MRAIFILLTLLFVLNGNSQTSEAQQIVDACITKHGGDKYKKANFAYDFRNNHYEYHYNNGEFRYELHSKDGKIKDVLTNNGFKRFVQGKEIEFSEKETKAYIRSVNSVHYFVFLPFFLNDVAVKKRLIGESTIGGKDYYKIEVTFDEENGGIDHKDQHMYWINKETNTMDYMAYGFHMNGGGVRFRSAINQREIGGIIFQDYLNFKHEKDTPLAELDALYEENKLTQVSIIDLVNIVKL
jgi:hypothetical protein